MYEDEYKSTELITRKKITSTEILLFVGLTISFCIKLVR